MRATRNISAEKFARNLKKSNVTLTPLKTFHSRVEHVHLKPFEEFFFVKKLVRLFPKELNYI